MQYVYAHFTDQGTHFSDEATEADELTCSRRQKELGMKEEFSSSVGYRSGNIIPAYHKQADEVFMDIKFCQLIAQD